LTCDFTKVISIELRQDWVDLAKQLFSKDINSGRLEIIQGDSNLLSNFVKDGDRTIFFLDAHVDNSNIKNYSNMCPLFNEIKAIGELLPKDNIILIDDLCILKTPFPWGERQYGNINFIDSIKEQILNINPTYKFKTLDGHVKDDVLLCYFDE
jgi:hypothetical protein